jgi:hypothetical protein
MLCCVTGDEADQDPEIAIQPILDIDQTLLASTSLVDEKGNLRNINDFKDEDIRKLGPIFPAMKDLSDRCLLAARQGKAFPGTSFQRLCWTASDLSLLGVMFRQA